MPTERVTFPGSTGADLAARLELPVDGEPAAFALFAHCFTCSKNLKAAVRLTRALAAERIGVVRFDFTGLGESEGDFADTTFSSNVDDLAAAAHWMEGELEAPSVLVGHSLGGSAVLHAAHRLSSVRAVATIGAPADPEHVLRHIGESREEIEAEGKAEVKLAGRRFTIRREFLEDLAKTRMREAVAGIERALLIFHSPIDEVVGIENAARLYEMARHPKSFVSLDRADHLLSDERPTPYDLLAAGLGACTSMTLRMYADRKEWPLEEVTVRLKHRKIHKKDEERCEEDGAHARLDRISREIDLQGKLSPEQRARLMEIADRCPVHRTLERGVMVETKEHIRQE